MQKHYFRSLLASLFLLISASLSAADFTGKTVQPVASGWGTEPVVFSLKEVAAKANLTAAQLVEKLDAWAETFISAEGDNQFTTPNPMILIENPATGQVYAKYTQGTAGGFWMDSKGIPQDWGHSDLSFYNTMYWSTAENDSLVFEIGQYPSRLLTGGEFTAHFIMDIDGGLYSISIDVVLVVESDFQEVETAYPKLTIVGEEELSFEQYPVDGNDSFSIDLEAIAEKLGCPAEYLKNNLSGSLYVAQLDNSEESLMPTARGDTLTNVSSANAIGWWWNTCTDEEGNPSNEAVRGAYGSSKYYSEGFKVETDAEGKMWLTGIIGQYATTLKAGDEFYNYVYVIFGSKAYALKFILKIVEDENNPVVPAEPLVLANMQKVGSQELQFEEYKGATDQEAVNLTAVAELMGEGWTADTLILAALFDETGELLTLKSTANMGGYWMNSKGVVVNWSGDGSTGNALYIEPSLSDGEVVLTSGNSSANVNEEDVYTFPMFYITPDSTKYYQLDITVTIKVHEDISTDDLVEVAVWPIEVETLTGGDYPIEEEPELDMAALEEAIGTRDPVFYGWSIPDAEGNSHPEDTYSMHCDPAPGWWFNADGYVSGWGSNSMVGVCLLPNGHLDLYRMPGVPKNGDVWNSKLILLNDATNKYVTIDLTIHFFDTLVKAEVVGEETVYIPEGDNEEPTDITPMLEALELEDEAYLTDNTTLMGYLPNGKWSNLYYLTDGLTYKDHKVVENVSIADEPDACDFNVGAYVNGDGTMSFYADRSEALDFTGTYSVDFAISNQNKAYVYHVIICDADAWVGIKGIQATAKKSQGIYTLAGQRVSKTTKGVYVIDGKKVAIK